MATKIICRASDCIFWEDKLCTSEEITYDPEEGCLTYEVLEDLDDLEEEEWDDDDLIDDDEEDDEDLDWEDEEEEEDLYLDEELEEDLDDDWRF